MAGIEEAFEKFVTRVSSREEPQDEYGDPQTGEKRIPLMQGIKRGYDFENTMPNYYNQRYDYENEMPIYQDDRYNIPQEELAYGGLASFANGGLLKPGKAISKIGGPTQQEIDAFVNQPIPIGQMIPVNEFLPGEDYQTYVRRKRAETGPALFAGEPVTMPVLPSTSTPQVDVSANPIARALEMAGFTREEIMRILGQQGFADGGLTNTIPPAKGPDSQGVESLFRRRYS